MWCPEFRGAVRGTTNPRTMVAIIAQRLVVPRSPAGHSWHHPTPLPQHGLLPLLTSCKVENDEPGIILPRQPRHLGSLKRPVNLWPGGSTPRYRSPLMRRG